MYVAFSMGLIFMFGIILINVKINNNIIVALHSKEVAILRL